MNLRVSALAAGLGAALCIPAVFVEILRSTAGDNIGLNLLSISFTIALSLCLIGLFAGLARVGKRFSSPVLSGACYATIASLLLFLAIMLGLLSQLQFAVYATEFGPFLLFARSFCEMSIGFLLISSRRDLGSIAVWLGIAALALGGADSLAPGVITYIFRVPFFWLGARLLNNFSRKGLLANSPLQI